MTKRERVLAACRGEATDRVSYSLWYHFRLDPPAGEGMARAELDFYRRVDPDLFKVMHDIPYEMPADMPVIEKAEDWVRLPVWDGVSGNFGQQLATVQQILAGKDDDGPVVDTLFGVFATAQKLCGKRTLEFLRTHPEATHEGLKRIAQSLANYARSIIAAGADGIYLAISGAASDTMPAEEYRQHFLCYDLQVLESASAGTVNVAHQHGVGIYPEMVLGLEGYAIYCWSDRLPGNPDIASIRALTNRCLMAGVNEATFGEVTPEAITQEAREAVSAVQGRGLILAPGCAVPTPPATPEANLHAIRAAVC